MSLDARRDAAEAMQHLRRIAGQGLAAIAMPGEWISHNYPTEVAGQMTALATQNGFTAEHVQAALSNDERTVRVKWEAE